jgi:hypothetical protein
MGRVLASDGGRSLTGHSGSVAAGCHDPGWRQISRHRPVRQAIWPVADPSLGRGHPGGSLLNAGRGRALVHRPFMGHGVVFRSFVLAVPGGHRFIP